MKVLYAIQGTGNGHISRARDIVPILQNKVDLDLLISGIQADVSLPYSIKYQLKGAGFIFGKSGGVDLMRTYRKADTRRFLKDVRNLPVQKYDLIINDFEPVSAWAAYFKKVPSVSLSHQSAILNENAPQPHKIDPVGKTILKNYAPTDQAYGFHFAKFDKNIFTPVIRQQLRQAEVQNLGHYTVYLPAFDDQKLIKRLKTVENVSWQVFSKHSKKAYREGNVQISPVNNEQFIQSLTSCEGILCGAGFETPAEALFLKKKLLVIPMKNQYEQYCNAAALEALGVPVLKHFKKKQLPSLQKWIEQSSPIEVDYPDITEKIIDLVLEEQKLMSNVRE
ncbi:glycosyltransferase family protein [Tunicatimonas pelagia]|uniref:glycosyltransferase family protein n=1 Tax=Tunicatimonas pelagia TaxID=931531 RepID=UPI0026669154|nr:glycosyltransferase family protein [Tunicatimonas pelagia]WKN42632.1 glycosyltransferase family protein [Tunicatimonas pelagia]